MSDETINRRDLLAGAAGALGGALLGPALAGQGKPAATPQAPPAAPALPPIPEDPAAAPGTPTSAVGSRSRFVTAARSPVGELAGVSYTPLQDLTGTLTPADLHFERHHAGVPLIDPTKHALIVHGLVERPSVYTLADLQRLPSVTRIHFVECSGNGRGVFKDPKNESVTAQRAAGMTANSEWTGVPLHILLAEVGVKAEASWFLAEGGDAARLARSIPVSKAHADSIIAWAQNGEPLRPEQGYPFRLLLPGWEGNTNVKWLRRLEFGTGPWMTRWETSKYTDPLANGTARQFSFEMDARSIITSPSFPRAIDKGWHTISGVAWTGRGKIRGVEVSVDSGRSWREATLHGPILDKAHTRFTMPWEWTGTPTTIMSRATDETGYVQPTRERIVAVRGPGTDYHINGIVGWKIAADGRVSFYGDS